MTLKIILVYFYHSKCIIPEIFVSNGIYILKYFRTFLEHNFRPAARVLCSRKLNTFELRWHSLIFGSKMYCYRYKDTATLPCCPIGFSVSFSGSGKFNFNDEDIFEIEVFITTGLYEVLKQVLNFVLLQRKLISKIFLFITKRRIIILLPFKRPYKLRKHIFSSKCFFFTKMKSQKNLEVDAFRTNVKILKYSSLNNYIA